MSETTLHMILDFAAPIIVALLTTIVYQRFKARADQKQAETDAEPELHQADAAISQTNITTAMALLDRIRKENVDLVARAE